MSAPAEFAQTMRAGRRRGGYSLREIGRLCRAQAANWRRLAQEGAHPRGRCLQLAEEWQAKAEALHE